MIYAGPARNESEFNNAIALAARTFNQAGAASEKIYERKQSILCGHGGVSADTVAILSHPEDGVIGAAFVVGREFVRGQERIAGAFISSICIDPRFRERGYSHDLMHAAMELASKCGAIMSVVIARRAVDHYYTRFGYWGVSQYNKVVLVTREAKESDRGGGVLRAASAGDLIGCAKLYENAYGGLFGNCVRNGDAWRNFADRMKYLNVVLGVLEDSGDAAAYALYDDTGNVYEIAANGGRTYTSMLRHLSEQLGCDALIFHASPFHPLVKVLASYDVTISGRDCVYGGHMARVHNETAFLRSIERRVENRAMTLRFRPCTEEYAGITIDWDGSKANAHKNSKWDGCAAGVARLLGVSTVTGADAPNLLDPPMPFNIPLADQI